MTSHRATRRKPAPAAPAWRLLLPAALLTSLVLGVLLVIPALDDSEADAREPAAQTSPSTRSSATHDSETVSRRLVRTGYQARRAVAMDNDRARAAISVLARREARRIEAARQERLERKRLKRERRLAMMAKSSSFRVGALNILGSQHTAGPGGYGPGTTRAAISAGIIASRGVDVVTLSEVQDDQLAVLNNQMGGYSIWPQHSLGSNGQRLQIAWRSSRFEMLDGGSVNFPFSNQSIPMPYVLLRDLATGAQFWVISIHTSAGGLEGERDAGTAIAISLMNRLMAESGKPVIIGGDVNEHEEFFYNVCQATGFLAANGGGAGCSLPPRPLRVDWIMGGGGNGVSFSGYVQDGATLGRSSDHYFIHADTTIVDPGER